MARGRGTGSQQRAKNHEALLLVLLGIIGTAFLTTLGFYIECRIDHRACESERDRANADISTCNTRLSVCRTDVAAAKARAPLFARYGSHITMYQRFAITRNANASLGVGDPEHPPFLRMQILGWSGTGDGARLSVMINMEDYEGRGTKGVQANVTAKPGCGVRVLSNGVLYEVKIESMDAVETLTVGIAETNPAPKLYAPRSMLVEPRCDWSDD